MIAPIKSLRHRDSTPVWHTKFLEMLPAIQRRASLAFRGLSAEAREDLIEEVVAHAVVAFKSLYDKGKVDLAYPTVLAMYGIRRVKTGRKIGTKLNVRDVSSEYCQLSKGIAVERLDRYDRDAGEWLEVLVEDRKATPADTAAARIDVSDWFRTLAPRDRRIAGALAIGNTTNEVAKRFRLTADRISKKRRAFHASWNTFQGEDAAADRDATAALA